ncbi:hypothetical protein [Levilactobacillus parabrevis]|uniref:hypothetical protein n=1 Tax=Levilactobacillus parabrevis TaxID=357278 RepID=UPI0037566F13
MVNPLTRGLRPELRSQIERENVIDFTKLQLEDVTRRIPTGEPELDWQSVVFIKNFRQTNLAADSVVVTMRDGFFRAALTPKALANLILTSTNMAWLNMGSYVKMLDLSEPLPIVSGKLRVVATEQPKHGGHNSWVGLQFVDNINAVWGKKQVRAQLDNGMEMIFSDSAARLRKKNDETLRIAHQMTTEFQYTQHHALSVDALLTQEEYDGQAAIEFHQRYLLVSGLNLMGISESQVDVTLLLKRLRQGNKEALHFDDERFQA